MNRYAQPTDNCIDRACWYRSQIRAVCCCILSAGVVAVICSIAPGNLSLLSVSNAAEARMAEKESNVDALISWPQRVPGPARLSSVGQGVGTGVAQPQLEMHATDHLHGSLEESITELFEGLFDRASKASVIEHAHLDNTMFGKAEHLHTAGITYQPSVLHVSNPVMPHVTGGARSPHSIHERKERRKGKSLRRHTATAAKADAVELPEIYDPEVVAQYFDKKRFLVMGRAMEVAQESGGWLTALATDKNFRQTTPDDELQRAEQLRTLLERLGPTFVKAGQAASIRVDLLPDTYARELRSLQDAVPPFPSIEAKNIIDEELSDKGGLAGVFSQLSLEPVASASLGQVYQGILKTGEKVAVKVQRPNVLEGIQMDLYLLRQIAPIVKKRNNLNTDLPGLVDEWGVGFVNELDYRSEARKAKEFNKAMQQQGVDTILAPEPFDNLTTRRVLVTKWIDGERLEESSSDDVSYLCGIALTAYLTMLLDTGCLHADPHPGNLMRTTDGRLCILDWGLTANISSEVQYAIVDYISHLVAEDYEAVPRDLVALGFVPKAKVQAVRDTGVAKTLASVFRSLASGGGAKKIAERVNVADIGAQVRDIQQKYGNILQTPTYFAYILRAFTILEGIGLQNNPDYALVQGCYPYIAKRLFRSNDQRSQEALKSILYKRLPGGEEQLNARKLIKLARAFRTYTGQRVTRLETDGKESDPSKEDPTAENQVLREALKLLLSAEGNYLQHILLKEIARTVDVASRQALQRAGLVEPITFALEQLAAVNPSDHELRLCLTLSMC
eukprot:gnl/TRDRNA2_/TRDRNA2_158435_c0_seq1.p1 gnl/TRDRNA2_/TRDRNA2_158435_c0~~gnl/TRDRNA2_/TRDRNA2_158435_c0_seq1.p1  ORF type:complete len:789 (+),score=111.05 gnl/TRDRNA2_/TRDRNA2_158435_c0_seq1:37-2403(+)